MGISRGSVPSRTKAAIAASLLCVGLVVTTAAPAAAATVVVNQNHEHGWHMQHTACPPENAHENTGDQRFVVGPEGAAGAPGNQDEPAGDIPDSDSPNGGPPGPSSGSLEMTTGANGNSVEWFRNTGYHGVPVDSIETLTYWTYEDPSVATDANGVPTLGYVPAIYIRLEIDTDGLPGPDDALIYEPAYQEADGQHDVDPAAWQEWIADDPGTDGPEGRWWLLSRDDVEFKTLDEWTPQGGIQWTISNDGIYGGVVLGAGCGEPEPWGDFVGNTDRFTIDANATGEGTTYDFEPGSPADATVLDCTPETAENPTHTNHRVTCTARNSEGVPIRNTEVDVEATGANDPDNGDSKTSPDFTCATDPEGVCSVVHGPGGQPPVSTDEAGNTVYTAWIDVDENDGSVEADLREGRVETQPAEQGDDREPDGTDVVGKTWIGRSAALGGVDAEPETSDNELGANHTVTATVYDQTGETHAGSTTVNFEFFEGSPSDTDGNTPGTPDKTCRTEARPSCSITYTQTATSGTDLICVFTNQAPDMIGSNFTGNCGGERRGDNDDDATRADAPEPANDDQDVVSKTWLAPGATRLDCEPENANVTNDSAHQIGCTVRSRNDLAVPNVRIDVEATGTNDPDGGDSPGSPDFTCTTNQSGSCSITHGPGGTGTTSSVGSTLYRAWIDTDGADATNEADATEGRDAVATPGTMPESDNTDVVERTWTEEPITQCDDGTDNDGDGRSDYPEDVGCGSASDDDESDEEQPRETCPGFANDPRNQIVGTPGRDKLNGTTGDDIVCALGGNDQVIAGAGDDLVIGSGGNDTMRGGSGADVMRGRRGGDVLSGGSGRDRLQGNQGSDWLNGGRDRDDCSGGRGRDFLRRCE